MTQSASRRQFLKFASALSVAGHAAPLALNLAAMGEAAAATASDYKAIVCVFLHGGNDHFNTVVPYDAASHALYKGFRPVTGHARDSLTATALSTLINVTRQYALAPRMTALTPLFESGKLGIIHNIGPLTQPITKSDYQNRKQLLPPKLFSHNDQQALWQSFGAEGSTVGWGGRMADLLMAGNGNASLTCINAASNAVFLSGQQTLSYRVGSNGPVSISALTSPLGGSSACSDALRTLLGSNPRGNYMTQATSAVATRSIDLQTTVSSALRTTNLTTVFPASNSLGSQLKVVAQMIGSSAGLGLKRQVFFVSLGGFDHHDGLLTDHPNRLQTVADALVAFYQATVEIGAADKVMTFTASDFGRSWGNDDGSDHGWGSTHFVMGGAVKGKQHYGQAPVLANNGPDDVGNGRLLPSTSVDQLAATVGRWMGLSDSQLLDILPNLNRFSNRDLGFI